MCIANGTCRVGVSVDRVWDSVRRRAGHVRAQGAGAETWHQDEMLILREYMPLDIVYNNQYLNLSRPPP